MIENDNAEFHSTCFACGAANKHGLHLNFKDDAEGCSCNVAIPPHFQSYAGVVHGGIVATMLDAAMVHSLRGHSGEAPVTCRLEVRYLRAVTPGASLTVNARRKGKRGKISLADAEVLSSGVCFARARGAFTNSEK
jgi:uncharacterized protein (TIGR00369 family)